MRSSSVVHHYCSCYQSNKAMQLSLLPSHPCSTRTASRLPMELDQRGAASCVQQHKGVHTKALHVAVVERNASIIQQKSKLRKTARQCIVWMHAHAQSREGAAVHGTLPYLMTPMSWPAATMPPAPCGVPLGGERKSLQCASPPECGSWGWA
jgi:hypothetical protein